MYASAAGYIRNHRDTGRGQKDFFTEKAPLCVRYPRSRVFFMPFVFAKRFTSRISREKRSSEADSLVPSRARIGRRIVTHAESDFLFMELIWTNRSPSFVWCIGLISSFSRAVPVKANDSFEYSFEVLIESRRREITARFYFRRFTGFRTYVRVMKFRNKNLILIWIYIFPFFI